VKTSRAQARIRQYLRQAEAPALRRDRQGDRREELRRFGLSLAKLHKGGELDKAANALGYRIADDLLGGIGYGKVTPLQLLQQVLPPDKLAAAQPTEPAPTSRIADCSAPWVAVPRRRGAHTTGSRTVLVRYGKCCNRCRRPFVGFITRGRGVTVHTTPARRCSGSDPDGRVDRRL